MFVNKVLTCFYIIIERVFVWFNAFFCEKGVIVMFHHVTNEELDEIPACLCKVERFKEIIDELRINYQIVSIDDIYEKTEKKKAVICTQSKVDARYKKINCADEYKNIHIELKKMDWEIFNKICAGIPEEDIQTFLKVSEKMLENIEK